MMKTAVLDFAKQFAYEPVIEHADQLQPYSRVIVAGMGGSHLAADLLRGWDVSLPLSVHSDYGLPHISEADRANTLFIASSYSGNTEETIDAYRAATTAGLPTAAIAVGGVLIDLVKADGRPYIQLPNTGIQPRSALGFSFRALLKLLNRTGAYEESGRLAESLHPAEFEEEGKALAQRLAGRLPVVYASTRNSSIAYNWKIKLNETGKIPAFCNVVPEMNHNEMTSFDVMDETRALSSTLSFIFLRDDDDHPRNQKRMEVTAYLLKERGFPVETISLRGATSLEKLFGSLLLADWTAVYTAEQYGLESEQVPMVEDFKKRILQ